MNCANYWFATGGFGQAFKEMFWLGFLVHLQPKPRPLWGENGLCCVLASAFTGRKSTQLTLCIVFLAQHWSHFASTPSAGVDHSICSYQPCIDRFVGPALELRYNVRLSKEEPGGTYPSKAWENICTKNHLQSHDEHCMPESLGRSPPWCPEVNCIWKCYLEMSCCFLTYSRFCSDVSVYASYMNWTSVDCCPSPNVNKCSSFRENRFLYDLV